MNSVVEKLAAIENEVAAIQPKMAPLTERIADLDQKVAGFAQQLSGIAEESAAVKQDIELTRTSLARIQTLIGESKAESEQLAAGQEENLQRCETMTAVFGAAFQAVAQFFETAQRMGLADQAQAVFQVPTIVPSAAPTQTLAPPLEKPSPNEPVVEKKPPIAERNAEEIPVMESLPEPSVLEPPKSESVLRESDFDSAQPDTDEETPDPWSAPDLPDVAAPPEMTDTDSNAESDIEPSSEIASQLDVPPLNLATLALPELGEPVQEDDSEDQEIEALLATMMTPVTATAGS